MGRALPSEPDNPDQAFDHALLILNAAAQTRSGLAQKLRRAGFGAEAATVACARAVQLGYVNDLAYARSLVRRRLREGRGIQLIAREMRHKGLADDVTHPALDEVDAEAELESANSLAAKLLRRHAGSEPMKAKQKVLAALARRGFSSGTCRRAWDSASSEAGARTRDLESMP